MTKTWNHTALLFLLAWTALDLGARYILKTTDLDPAMSVLVVALPGVMFAVFLWMALRQMRRADELEQRIQADALATGFGVSLLGVTTLALAQQAGLASLDEWSFMLFPLMLVFYLLGMSAARRRYSCGPE